VSATAGGVQVQDVRRTRAEEDAEVEELFASVGADISSGDPDNEWIGFGELGGGDGNCTGIRDVVITGEVSFSWLLAQDAPRIGS
jgi:hypothetical protein